jgi:hypothetical protein
VNESGGEIALVGMGITVIASREIVLSRGGSYRSWPWFSRPPPRGGLPGLLKTCLLGILLPLILLATLRFSFTV